MTFLNKHAIVILRLEMRESTINCTNYLEGDLKMEFENVIKNFNQYKNFADYDESKWDYFEDDEFYERTSDWDVPYYGEDWSENGF